MIDDSVINITDDSTFSYSYCCHCFMGKNTSFAHVLGLL